MHLEVEQEFFKILGLDNSPVLQLEPDAQRDMHLGSADLNQVSLLSPGFHAVDKSGTE